MGYKLCPGSKGIAMASNRAPRLVLASSSPQRRTLLAEAGYEFRLIPPGSQAECGVCSRETPPETVARLARQKAADVAIPLGRAGAEPLIVIGCDTLAVCAGHILGKPRDEAHAREMLRLLSGREHQVISGLCLWPCPAGQPQVRVETTALRMDALSDAEIDEYVASRLWEGKAGAFGYQDRMGWLTIVSGSESNVIGLPLELLKQMLAEIVSTGPNERK
jgi:septum formation protein